MAMHAWIMAANGSDLSEAEKNPELFWKLKDSESPYVTPFFSILLYFLRGGEFADKSDACGDAAADERSEILETMIFGGKQIPYKNVECGFIGVLSPADIQRLNEVLAEIDQDKLNAKILDARISENLQELIDEEELYELEWLSAEEIEEMPDLIEKELSRIRDFYRRVEENQQGAWMYVS